MEAQTPTRMKATEVESSPGNLMSESKSAVSIGARLEMLVDDWLIDRCSNITLHLTTPRREEIVWTNEKSWEGPTSCYFKVVQDGALIRLYYRGVNDEIVCYAESRDGIHFERPNLGQYEFEGERNNNIVFQGSEADSFASHNFAPFLDTNPQALTGERYKAIGGHRRSDGTGRALYAFSSPDGIRWKKWRDEPIITEGKFDSLNVAFWDEVAGFYRSYSRVWVPADGAAMPPGGLAVYAGLRGIQSSASNDFLNWSPGQPNSYSGSAPPEEFYTNAVTPAPNAPHILLAFPMRFVANRQKNDVFGQDGICDTVFMSSRNGVQWDRTFGEAFVRPGLDPRNWTDRSTMTAAGFAVTAPEEFSFYVSEHYRWPDNRLRRYSIRRDGFASLRAGAPIGEWTTRPLTFEGRNLKLNYSTSAAGSLRVEVQNEAGQPLPGYGLGQSGVLFGDELDGVVRWENQADLQSLQGQAIRLRFVMQDADLYALQFRE